MSDILTNKIVITKKPHRCWGCLRMFPINTAMGYISTAGFGTVIGSYWCNTCQEVLSKEDYQYGDEIGAGELIDNYPEYYA